MNKNKNFFGEADNVLLKAYDPTYPQKYAEEIRLIIEILKDRIIHDYHIGSTAIPGMMGKPVIDMAVTVNPFPLSAHKIQQIKAQHYIFWEDNPDPERMFFLKGMPRTHHLHIYPRESKKLQDQLIFKAMLLKDETLRQEYTDFKIALAAQFYDDREAYTQQKTAFVNKVLAMAKEK